MLKYYDMSVLYHPDKVNIVVDSLSPMTMGSVSHLDNAKKDPAREVRKLVRLGVRLESSPHGGDLREVYWWEGLKRDIAEFVAKCPNCQQVKQEHLMRGGLLQEIKIPTWKWEEINMDFFVGLPRTQKSYDSIWMVLENPLALFPSSLHIRQMIKHESS